LFLSSGLKVDDSIFNSLSNLKIKGSHRKMTDRHNSDPSGAKEINGSPERLWFPKHQRRQCCVTKIILAFPLPGSVILDGVSLSFSCLMDKSGTFSFPKVRF
jgi:hypothetical protein